MSKWEKDFRENYKHLKQSEVDEIVCWIKKYLIAIPIEPEKKEQNYTVEKKLKELLRNYNAMNHALSEYGKGALYILKTLEKHLEPDTPLQPVKDEGVSVLKECDEYLSQETYEKGKPVHLNSIGAYSVLHKKIKQVLSSSPEPSPLKEGLPDQKEGVEAGKILYPLELQMLIFDYVAWLESMIPNVKKSLRPQIIEKIKKLGEYRFAPPEPSSKEQEGEEILKSAMDKFGEAHTLLSRTKLSSAEYQPISSLLSHAKVELFNFYQLYKNKPIVSGYLGEQFDELKNKQP